MIGRPREQSRPFTAAAPRSRASSTDVRQPPGQTKLASVRRRTPEASPPRTDAVTGRQRLQLPTNAKTKMLTYACGREDVLHKRSQNRHTLCSTRRYVRGVRAHAEMNTHQHNSGFLRPAAITTRASPDPGIDRPHDPDTRCRQDYVTNEVFTTRRVFVSEGGGDRTKLITALLCSCHFNHCQNASKSGAKSVKVADCDQLKKGEKKMAFYSWF